MFLILCIYLTKTKSYLMKEFSNPSRKQHHTYQLKIYI
jgi:hypothetical protein